MWAISDLPAAGAPSAQSQQCPAQSAAEQTSDGGILQTLMAFLCGSGCTFVVAAAVVYLVWLKLHHDKTR